jgi:glycosyltransferase involved in cell wall biosynthesis
MLELNKTPEVTVAVITYNQKDLLKQTIDSILAQKTKYAFNIAICDDASPDDTELMCLKYVEKYPEIVKYYRLEKNGGITKNCNQGIQNCNGKYLALIGGDDLFVQGKLEKQTQYMEDNPNVTISYHPVDIFDSNSDQTLFLTNQTRADTPKTLLELVKICIPGSVSVMVRRDAIPTCGFDERLPTVSDWLFYLEVAAKGEIGFINETLARYRKHGNQASFRTYELLNESLQNLDLAAEKLGERPGLSDAIAQGKARYVSGEAFRQLIAGNTASARTLLKQANGYLFKWVHWFGVAISYMPYAPLLMRNIRYLLKKIV